MFKPRSDTREEPEMDVKTYESGVISRPFPDSYSGIKLGDTQFQAIDSFSLHRSPIIYLVKVSF